MSLRVTGKNLEIGDALRERVETRLSGALDRYFDGGFSGHVTVEREGTGFKSDCALHLDTGIVLKARGEADDAYQSFDAAAGKLEKRLRRYHRKLKDHHFARRGRDEPVPAAMDYTFAAYGEDEDAGGDHPPIIAETELSLPELSVGDAVMRMDLSEASILLFRHAAHGRLNVVYRRSDGNIGWIDPAGGNGQG